MDFNYGIEKINTQLKFCNNRKINSSSLDLVWTEWFWFPSILNAGNSVKGITIPTPWMNQWLHGLIYCIAHAMIIWAILWGALVYFWSGNGNSHLVSERGKNVRIV